MALSNIKTFIDGEVLTASDLNAMNNNVINNQQAIGTPRTILFDMAGFELVLDGDTSITSDTSNQVDFKVGGTDVLVLTATTFRFNGDDIVTTSDIRRLGLSGIASRLAWTELRVNQIEEQSILEHQVFA